MVVIVSILGVLLGASVILNVVILLAFAQQMKEQEQLKYEIKKHELSENRKNWKTQLEK